jgi:predicted GTPase
MDTFVVHGCSAGGLATLTWIDTIAQMIHDVNPNVNVFGFPDSGFFVDYPSNITGKHDYAANIKAVVQLANHGDEPLPNKKCMADVGATNPEYCLMAEHLVKYIDTPLIIEQSLYDSWQMENIL